MATKNGIPGHYVERVIQKSSPRLPLTGLIDFTYRCNLSCRHCWLNIPANVDEKNQELTHAEIVQIVGDARAWGCREWCISGGEPMLREDFTGLFDFITSHSSSYSINTNGTLITPAIARLMRRPGDKMVAIYGATAKVHDHITRVPGSFEAAMRGISHLREAGAGFCVQLAPLQENIHEFADMVQLGQSLSSRIRVGAPWLWLRADGDQNKNEEIKKQRLSPADIIRVNEIDFSESPEKDPVHEASARNRGENRLFPCIDHHNEFHIDPYGQMSFCLFVKNPRWRFDLRKGTFRTAWEEFIPALASEKQMEQPVGEGCSSCKLAMECNWCPSYAYLEHGRESAPIPYLCEVAAEKNEQRKIWQEKHQRYFAVAGITIRVDMPLPIQKNTFDVKFKEFEVDGPGEDLIVLQHFFQMPSLDQVDLGEQVYRKVPWAIYRSRDSWIYKGISPGGQDRIHCLAVFNNDHTRGRIYHPNDQFFHDGDLESIAALPTDQIVLARVLADRQAGYLHSAGVIYEGQGFVFAGHSGAGKSTTVSMIRDMVTILCDDRMIVRKHPEGWKIYGSWSHGDISEVSSQSAPLSAILFLVQSKENRLERIVDREIILHKLLACLIKPLETADWWDKMLTLVTGISQTIPCYQLHLDKSGKVRDILRDLAAAKKQ